MRLRSVYHSAEKRREGEETEKARYGAALKEMMVAMRYGNHGAAVKLGYETDRLVFKSHL